MTGPAVEFWFEFASTYSYPAAMRILDRVAGRAYMTGTVIARLDRAIQ